MINESKMPTPKEVAEKNKKQKLTKKQEGLQQERENYEKDAEQRAKNINSTLENLLQKIGVNTGKNKMDIIEEDAYKENKTEESVTAKLIDELKIIAAHEGSKRSQRSSYNYFKKTIKGGALLEIELDDNHKYEPKSWEIKKIRLNGVDMNISDLDLTQKGKLLQILKTYTDGYQEKQKEKIKDKNLEEGEIEAEWKADQIRREEERAEKKREALDFLDKK